MYSTTTAAIVVVLSLCLSGFTAAQDVESLRKMLFEDDPRLGYSSPEKTLEYLKKLRSLSDEGDGKHYSRMIGLSENHADKCDQPTIREFLVDFVLYPKGSKNMEVYYLCQWNQRKMACKETWKKLLQTQVRTLTPDEEKLVNQLTESVFQNVAQSNYKSSFSWTGTLEFASGILPYFVENIKYPIKKLLKGRQHNKMYEDEFQRLVLNLCGSIESKFKESIELFKWFIYFDKSNYVDDDQSTKFWLENIEVCKRVNRTKLRFEKQLYRLLKDIYLQPGCFGGCGGGSYVME